MAPLDIWVANESIQLVLYHKPFWLEFHRRGRGWVYRRRWDGYSTRWLKTSDAGKNFLIAKYQA